MIETTEFVWILQAIDWPYWVLAIISLALAITVPKNGKTRALTVLLVVALLGYWPAVVIGERKQYQDRLEAAMAHFEMRCQSAGEEIAKVVVDVDGIVWMKWRPEEINFGDQFKFDDPYGADCHGEECIKKLLRVTKGAELDSDEAKRHAHGYSYVETIDPKNGMRYRYIGVVKSVRTRTPEQIEAYISNSGVDPGPHVYGFALERHHIDHYSARYGVTWEDISTREDREYWVAGGSLKVVDLQTNQLLAERVGFMIDKALGSTAGFRQPWSFAQRNVCPEHYKGSSVSYAEKTLPFVTKIIAPSK